MRNTFTVVNYDQRAAGKTYNANDTLTLGKTINIKQYADDAIKLAEFIAQKYKKKKKLFFGAQLGNYRIYASCIKKTRPVLCLCRNRPGNKHLRK